MMCNPQKFKDLPLSVWDLFSPFLVNLQACEFSSPQGENTRSVRPLYRNFSESPSTRVILWRLLSIDSSVNSSVKKKRGAWLWWTKTRSARCIRSFECPIHTKHGEKKFSPAKPTKQTIKMIQSMFTYISIYVLCIDMFCWTKKGKTSMV